MPATAPATINTISTTLTDEALRRERGMVWDRLSRSARALLIHLDQREAHRAVVDGIPVPVRHLDMEHARRILDLDPASLHAAINELFGLHLVFPLMLYSGDYAIVAHAHARYAALAARALRRNRPRPRTGGATAQAVPA